MNRILFFASEIEHWTASSGERELIRIPSEDFRARHMRNVLRVDSSQELRSGILSESKGTLHIREISTDYILCEYVSETWVDAEFEENKEFPQMHFLIGHLRPPVMARVLRDLSAMGIHSVHVFISDTTEKSYANASLWSELSTHLLQGAMQGDICRIPAVYKYYSLDAALNESVQQAGEMRIVCRQGATLSFLEAVNDSTHLSEGYTVAIGTERGFTEREDELLDAAGFSTVAHLGGRVLRAESAIAVCAGILQMKFYARNALSPMS